MDEPLVNCSISVVVLILLGIGWHAQTRSEPNFLLRQRRSCSRLESTFTQWLDRRWFDLGLNVTSVDMSCSPLCVQSWQALEALLCLDNVSSAGYIRLERARGCEPPGRVSTNILTDEWLSHQFGPDEIHVVLEGPEIIATEVVNAGMCVYFAVFRITRPGTFRVRALLLREHYSAVSELLSGWPPLVFNLALGNSCTFSITHELKSAEKKLCNAASPTKGAGRWVTQSVLNQSLNFLPLPRNQSMPWHVHPHSGVWIPYDCQLNMDAAAARQCFSGRKMVFMGDSHMRTFFNDVIYTICHTPNSSLVGKLGGFGESQCLQFSSSDACKDLRACYVFNALGENVVQLLETTGVANETYDVIVANFGQHPAAGHRWTLEKYTTELARYFSDVDRWYSGRKVKPVLVWQATQYFPLRNDIWVRNYGDWRTVQRLEAYNHFSDRLVLSRTTWKLHRNNLVTKPMLDAYADDAHFPAINDALRIAQIAPFLDVVGCG